MRCANVLKSAVNACKKVMHKAGKKVMVVGTAVATMAISAVNAFAADGTTVDQASIDEAVTAAQNIVSSMTAVLNITNIIAILSACMGAATVLFLGWWGARKVVRVVVNAFAKGKLSI